MDYLFVGSFLDFKIKKVLFCFLDCVLKLPLVFDISWGSVLVKISATIHIPPTFEMFGNIDYFWIVIPKAICGECKSTDDIF